MLAVYTDATSGTGWWYEGEHDLMQQRFSPSCVSHALTLCVAGGGLFRHVWLLKRSPVHLTTWGTFVAPHVSTEHALAAAAASGGAGRLQGKASLNISAVVAATAGAAAGAVSATFDLISTAGATVTTLKAAPVTVAAGSEGTLHATGEVSAPVDLWTVRAPTLYTVRTQLLSAAGAVLDESNTAVGFRSLRFDADSGFHMNEQHVKVRGFCDHNDFANVGVGVPDRVNLFRAQVRHLADSSLELGLSALETASSMTESWTETDLVNVSGQAARSIGGNGRRTR